MKDALVNVFGRDASGGAFVEEEMVVSGTGACMRTVPEDSGLATLRRNQGYWHAAKHPVGVNYPRCGS